MVSAGEVLEACERLAAAQRLGARLTVIAGEGIGASALVEHGAGIVSGSLPEALREDAVVDAGTLMARELSATLSYPAGHK